MTQPTQNRSELALRLYRTNMTLLFVMILALGALVLCSVLWPDGVLSRAVARAPGVIPVAIVLFAVVQQTLMRRHRFSLDEPAAKAMEQDEWRRASMARATRGALVTVVAAQAPLALLFVHLPTVRALWGMVGMTVTLAMAAQIGLFLFFDRE
ncbi:MAG: hypothetical protein ABIT01_03050 [Thermoanaerobaculia bacterium]